MEHTVNNLEDLKVKKYFEDTAANFDGIYDNKGNMFNVLVNKLFRKGMAERVRLTIQICEPGKTLLDVGCGSGRISLPLAEKGLKVTGVDYSMPMISMADMYKIERESKLNKKLDARFVCCDFMNDFSEDEHFDISIALGVTDYIENSAPLLKKMKAVSTDRMIVSFPSRYTFQMPIRKAWLRTKHCPVYFYTEKDVRSIFRSIGADSLEIIKVPAVYLAVAHMK